MRWHESNRWLEINNLTDCIEEAGISYGWPLSLASKAMFLMRPEEVLPFDNRVKKALKVKGSRPAYASYLKKAIDFGQENQAVIDKWLMQINNMLNVLEYPYSDYNMPFDKIRRMRFLDKLLWTKGGDK
ncbi:MAG: hypothetical protein H6575_08890 [Lewinellaceae bacterium]|nr:hypothetical protein [Lewinellaceae bacterium]